MVALAGVPKPAELASWEVVSVSTACAVQIGPATAYRLNAGVMLYVARAVSWIRP